MMVLITYDVSTVDSEGVKRLRKVAKNVSTMDKEFRILSLSALLEPANSLN